jgi:hypothetical protein
MSTATIKKMKKITLKRFGLFWFQVRGLGSSQLGPKRKELKKQVKHSSSVADTSKNVTRVGKPKVFSANNAPALSVSKTFDVSFR